MRYAHADAVHCIADTRNNRIRMVTKSTDTISTVAGSGAVGYGGDSGPATFDLLISLGESQ
jgi:hypothetical protein